MTAARSLTVLLIASLSALAQDNVPPLDEQLEQATKKAAARVAPCVVRIQTVGGMEFIGNREQGAMLQRGRGPTTGVIVSDDGYIISSSFNFAHKPAAITVSLPGRREPSTAKIVAHDQTRMLTLLKVDVAGQSPLPVPEAAPKAQVRIGQWAMAMGRTWSDRPIAPPSVSVGIVSALDRIWGKAIQTDAKVSPVNYGGPLVDLQGRVIGILVPLSPRAEGETAGVEWYDGGIGFAVPMEDILKTLPRLKEGKDLRRGVLGFRPKSADEFSVPPVIDSIEPDSTADKAGLQTGDQIVEMEGKTISRYAQVRHLLGPKYEGDKLSLKVKRGDKVLEFPNLELKGPASARAQAFLGILPMRDDATPGVELRYVFPDSPAAKAGLKVGDRITAVGGRPVLHREMFLALLASRSPGMELPLSVKRKEGGKLDTVKVKLGLLVAEAPPTDLPNGTKKQALARKVKPDAPGMPPMPGVPNMPGQPRQPPPQQPKPKEQPKPEKPKEVKKGFHERNDTTLGRAAWVYVPEDYDPNITYGLVVWLHPQGDPMREIIRRTWEPLCKEHHLILYAPLAENPGGWMTSEIDTIRGDLRDLLKEYSIDSERVVLHGLGKGADLALYMGFDASDIVRGVIAIGGFLPSTVKEPESEGRLAFFLLAGGRDPNIEAIRSVKDRLSQKLFPLVYRELPNQGTGYVSDPGLVKELVRWIDSLDRM